MKKLFVLCFLLKTQTLLNGQLTASDNLWRAHMVSKNDTNKVGRLNALGGANEFTYANMRGTPAGRRGRNNIYYSINHLVLHDDKEHTFFYFFDWGTN